MAIPNRVAGRPLLTTKTLVIGVGWAKKAGYQVGSIYTPLGR